MDPTHPTAHVSPARRHRRLLAALGLFLAVAVLVGGFLVGASTSPDRHGEAARADASVPAVPSTSPSMPGATDEASTDTSLPPVEAPGIGPATVDAVGPVGPPATPPTGGPDVAPGVLVAPPSLDLDPGLYEGTIELRNIGGSPLTWGQAAPAALTLSPTEGTIPAGGSVQVGLSFDWTLHPEKEWSLTIQFVSTGGSAEVDVTGQTLLPPMMQIVGGNYAGLEELTFTFHPGLLNGQLVFKNDGDLPLDIDIDAPELTVGQVDLVLVGGAETALVFSPCGAPPVPANHPPMPVVRTIGLHTNTWQGDVELTVVFLMVPGQFTPGC